MATRQNIRRYYMIPQGFTGYPHCLFCVFCGVAGWLTAAILDALIHFPDFFCGGDCPIGVCQHLAVELFGTWKGFLNLPRTLRLYRTFPLHQLLWRHESEPFLFLFHAWYLSGQSTVISDHLSPTWIWPLTASIRVPVTSWNILSITLII